MTYEGWTLPQWHYFSYIAQRMLAARMATNIEQLQAAIAGSLDKKAGKQVDQLLKELRNG